jgi:hypothetical protein
MKGFSVLVATGGKKKKYTTFGVEVSQSLLIYKTEEITGQY